jgi:outer membrane protein
MKKIIIAVAMLCITTAAFAQQKLGHLNSVEVLQAMPEYKQINESVEKKKTEFQKVLETLYAEYEKKGKEVQKDPNMAKAMMDMKVQEIKDLEKRIQDFQQKAQEDIQKYAQDLAKPVQEKYASAVKQIAKEQGYSYIFDIAAGGTVYFPETGTDITQAVKIKLGGNLAPAPKPMGTPVRPAGGR